ncbi:hypothetical protein EYF80_032374 [Liparis tanakae]|uniref:Uncharacterized protein n=1 Tax=Liparis tanakae TaxID=230148 RepID=A0A4Z2GWE0_9TELE|nr:hypothetical protein EYF80_032374 [Liparis tanakae]
MEQNLVLVISSAEVLQERDLQQVQYHCVGPHVLQQPLLLHTTLLTRIFAAVDSTFLHPQLRLLNSQTELVQDLGSLAEVFKDELQRAGHQWGDLNDLQFGVHHHDILIIRQEVSSPVAQGWRALREAVRHTPTHHNLGHHFANSVDHEDSLVDGDLGGDLGPEAGVPYRHHGLLWVPVHMHVQHETAEGGSEVVGQAVVKHAAQDQIHRELTLRVADLGTRQSARCRVVASSSNREAMSFPWGTETRRALELVAEVADCRSVVLRKTCCCFLYSSPVRNFSCSA